MIAEGEDACGSAGGVRSGLGGELEDGAGDGDAKFGGEDGDGAAETVLVWKSSE